MNAALHPLIGNICHIYIDDIVIWSNTVAEHNPENLDWPIPTSSTKVQAFLGLMRYIVSFLPKLADYTYILIPLTNKCAKTHFSWTGDHQCAFESIKALTVEANCLTVMDHANPGENRIFVTCDTSDWCTGAYLSFGKMHGLSLTIQCNLVLQKRIT